jgi:DNA-binding NarL/FixJ family response regulator
MRTLAARFAVTDFEVDVLGETEPTSVATPPEDEVLLKDTARYLAGELTPRQAEILLRDADKVADIARAVGCSVGTVINEQRRIANLVTRHSADTDERDDLLNYLADLLYENIDG